MSRACLQQATCRQEDVSRLWHQDGGAPAEREEPALHAVQQREIHVAASAYSLGVEPSVAADVAILNGERSFVPVEEASVDGGPVACVRHGEVGAVLWLSRCGTCDDGTIAADINIYRLRNGEWTEDGGGGGDWAWPVGYAPDEDVDSDAFEMQLDPPDGHRLRLIPGYGPSGAVLRAQLDGPDEEES